MQTDLSESRSIRFDERNSMTLCDLAYFDRI